MFPRLLNKREVTPLSLESRGGLEGPWLGVAKQWGKGKRPQVSAGNRSHKRDDTSNDSRHLSSAHDVPDTAKSFTGRTGVPSLATPTRGRGVKCGPFGKLQKPGAAVQHARFRRRRGPGCRGPIPAPALPSGLAWGQCLPSLGL